MRAVDDLEVSFAPFEPPRLETRRGLFDRLEQRQWLVITCLVALAYANSMGVGFVFDDTYGLVQNASKL